MNDEQKVKRKKAKEEIERLLNYKSQIKNLCVYYEERFVRLSKIMNRKRSVKWKPKRKQKMSKRLATANAMQDELQRMMGIVDVEIQTIRDNVT